MEGDTLTPDFKGARQKGTSGTELGGWNCYAEVPSQPDMLDAFLLEDSEVKASVADVGGEFEGYVGFLSGISGSCRVGCFPEQGCGSGSLSEPPLPCRACSTPSGSQDGGRGWESSPRPGQGDAHTTCLDETSRVWRSPLATFCCEHLAYLASFAPTNYLMR